MKHLLFLLFVFVSNTVFCQDSLVYDNSGRIYKIFNENGEIDYFDVKGIEKNVSLYTDDSIYLKDEDKYRQIAKLVLKGITLPRNHGNPPNPVMFSISMVIETDGSVSNIRIIQGIEGFLDCELLDNIDKVNNFIFDTSKIKVLPCEFMLVNYISY
ncbi:hypothetical protein WAF17_20205 [Bernardetia sp. ABR2-2B]|uniref:hypothetical protein n=1 Tax=Bernardetia sp. ABR2-2B TaxID=3127472 RepID=UPI0030CDAD03